MDIGFIVITLLAFGFIGWYGVGSLYNRYRSNKIMKIIWAETKKYRIPGELTTLGSSGFIINIDKPTERISKLSIGVVMSKRELPINWMVDLIRGKRDTLMIKAVLNEKPKYDFDIFRTNNYYGKNLRKRLNEKDRIEINSISIYPTVVKDRGKVNMALKFMEKEGDMWWISLKKEGVHLLLISNLKIASRIKKVLRLVEDLS